VSSTEKESFSRTSQKMEAFEKQLKEATDPAKRDMLAAIAFLVNSSGAFVFDHAFSIS
jgi:hypothetical protein